MRKPVHQMLMAGIVLAAFATSAFSDLTPAQSAQARALIAQFSDRRFAARQEAVDKLIAMGPDVLPMVRKALAETDDAEVKLRCGMVIKGIEEGQKGQIKGEGPPAATNVPFGGMNLGTSKVSMVANEVKVADILVSFAKQSGNHRIALPRRRWRDRPVSLRVKDLSYWQALDALCKGAGVRYEWNTREGRGVALIGEGRTRDINAYVGPVVVKINGVSLARDYVSDRGTMTFFCHCFWEDRLPVVHTEIEVSKLTVGDGTAVAAPRFPRVDAMTGITADDRYWQGCGGRFDLHVREFPEGTRRIVELSGEVRLDLGTGTKQVSIPRGDGKKAQTVRADDFALTVTPLAGAGARPWWFRVEATRGGKTFRPPAYPSSYAYGFWLIDADGKKVRKGTWLMRQDNPPGQRRMPREPLTLIFGYMSKVKGDLTLVYYYPEKRTRKAYAFKFEDVALP